MNKTIKSKLYLAIILTFVVVLSALMGYSYAIPDDPKDVSGQQSESSGSGNPAPGYITLDDLKNRYDILCCQRGVHLPSGGNVVVSDGGQSASYGYLTANDIGKKIFMTGWTTSPSNPYSGTTSETYGYYKVGGTHICTPKEAWIIAEMIRNGSYPSEVQYAWWGTIFGGQGPSPTENTDLENEADAFEAYIGQVASTDPSTFVDTQYTYTVDGKTHSGTVKAPNIKYEPKWNEDANQDGDVNSHDNVTVSWNNDIQRYVIGPFSINYVEAKGKFGSRDEVMFAGITHAKLYTDLGEVEPAKWDFEWTDLGREASDYPHPNEVFYIDMDFIQDAKYFKNLHFDFVYMNAGAQVDKLEGTYFKCTWSPKYETRTETEGEGDDATTTTYYRYWDELTAVTPQPSQMLAYGVIGARWNNDAVLDWTGDEEFEPHEGKIIVKKVVLDQNGQPMQSNGDTFKFKVTINGESYTIKLKAGETRTFKQTWEHDAPAPTYSVEEIELPDGYRLEGITNASGTFADDATIEVVATNKVDSHEGKLRIRKEVSEPAQADEVYKFAVYINESLYTTVTLTVPEGQTSAETVIEGIKWNGTTAPSYKVEEIEVPSFVKDVRYEGQTGQLSENAECVVKAINNTDSNHGKLVLLKEVTEPADQDEVYKLNVHVDGFEDEVVTLTVPAGATKSNVVEKEYSWRGNENRNYKVEEIEVPSFVKDVKISNATGSLSDESEIKVTAINNTDSNRGSLRIEKKVTELSEQDEVYKFKVHVDGFEDEIVTITVPAGKDSSYWEKEYKWRGSGDRAYSVEEVEIPDFVKDVTYENQTGTLKDGTQFTVTATNKIGRPLQSKIKILKTVSDPATIDEVYKFNVHVDGYTDEVVEILVPKGATTGQGETTQVYSWTSDQEAPHYEVKEIEIPAGFTVTMTNEKGQLVADKVAETTVSAYNAEEIDQHGTLVIKKVVDGINLYPNAVFTYRISITDYKGVTEVITASSKANEEVKIERAWKHTQAAPTYKVEEINIPVGFEFGSIDKPEGSFANNETVSVKVTNKGKDLGYIRITKQVEGTVDPTQTFSFKVTVTESDGQTTEYKSSIAAGKTWTIARYWTHGDQAPTYKVEEIDVPAGYKIKEIKNAEGSFASNQTVEIVAINQGKVKGTLTIVKEIDGRFDINQLFKFRVTVHTADGDEVYTKSIKVGEYWNLTQEWYEGDEVPTYKVEEVDIPDGYKLKEIQNGEGSFDEGKTVRIVATNYGKEQGRLRVTKKVENATDTDTVFNFKVRIGDDTFVFGIRAGYSWESDLITWNKGEEAPSYSVEEVNVPDGYVLKEITNQEGKLNKDSVVVATAINEAVEEHEGRISLTKKIIVDDKVKDDAVEGVFDFKITISGTFEMDGQKIENGSKVIETSLAADQTYESPTIKWKGKTAPIFSIAEVNLPEGWTFDSMTCSNGVIEEDTTTKITCINRFKSYLEYELTIDMGGIVWHDVPLNPNDKNTPDSVPNGIYDQGTEEGIEKAEVRIYRYVTDEDGNNPQLTGLATAYDEDGNPIEWPIYTEADGTWRVPKVEITALKEGELGAIKYSIEFGYDGQTYEPTDFLVTGDGVADNYKKASRAERNKFLFDSHAIEDENERDKFNRKFAEITGDQPMQDDFTTQGYTNGDGVEGITLEYIASDSMATTGATRKESTLITRDEQNYVMQKYIMKASTGLADLLYPFDLHLHLLNINKTLVTSGDKIGLHKKYTYSATYPYTQSINLGLVTRKEAELAATKDVYSATVAIDQKLLKYKYNEAVDFENVKYQDYLNLQTEIENAGIDYTLDLFKTDYYYRAAIYQDVNNQGGLVGQRLENFYKSLGYNDLAKELNLDVYVTYKLSVYNDCETYYATINELADYFDEDYELVSTTVDRYIQEANGVSVNRVTDIAEKSFYKKASFTTDGNLVKWGESDEKKDVSWTVAGQRAGSDGTIYNRMTTKSLKGEVLAPGERINVYVTFRVKNDSMDIEGYGIGNCVRMGKKSNICEIANYSTYNSADTNDIAGRVDKDSAPNNVNIENHNEKSWYEDDTDSAPTITLTLYTINREVNGQVWEDKETSDIQYGQRVGNGKLENNESTISGLTTELWEKVRVKDVDDSLNVTHDSEGREVYVDYDFLWPEDFEIEGSGHTLKEVTGFDSTIKSGDEGKYEFTGVPTGNYVVRFTYGDDDAAIADPHGPEVRTADYDNDQIPAVYNGQDFKTSTYQPGFEAITTVNGYVNNEWHDLENDDLAEARVNDARDSESRRLAITSLSRYLANANTTIMNSANFTDDEHKDLRNELYSNYYMTADTAKINLNIENMPSLKKQTVTITNPETGLQEEVLAGEVIDVGGISVNYVKGKVRVGNGGNSTDSLDFTYTVKNIDFGIEERASTEIKLDKEIEKIQVQTNDGTTILNADYNIDYDMKYDVSTGRTEVTPKVSLNPETKKGTDNLQALNKDEKHGLQNFRYINYDTSMAQSLSLVVTYKFAIFNLGEVDRIGYLYEERFEDPAKILELSQKVGEQRYSYTGSGYVKTPNADGTVYGDVFGWYLGRVYYKGDKLSQAEMSEDKIVETRVDQLIDYVDNDAVFEQANNYDVNNSWRPVGIDELLDEELDPIIDRNLIEDIDGGKNIQDSNGVVYVTNERDNIILSIDHTADMTKDSMNNRDFVVRTVPYAIEANGADVHNKVYTASMRMVMNRSIDSQINDDNAAFDNVAEIVKLDNTAGRRDVLTIAGNVEPKKGEFKSGIEERDGSATELITFSPPTGLSERQQFTLQIVLGALIGMTILAAGIVVIKKKVLDK